MQWDEIARRQCGVVTRTQMVALGVGVGAVNGLLKSGRIERSGVAGVYRVSGAPITRESECWRAVLAARAPLSYLSAALWWDMPADGDGYLHVTRLQRRRFDWPAGIRIHRVGLAPEAVVERRGLPVTTPAETALDCMGWLPLSAARTFTDRAVQQGWVTAETIERRLEEASGRWGNRQLRRLLPQVRDGAAAESERRLHKLLSQAGIGGWLANHRVRVGSHTYFIDVAFPEGRLGIEIDGFAHHSGLAAFQLDRQRQNRLVGAGWTILRFTWADLDQRPDWVIATIRSLLAGDTRIGG